jgi:hypothetical protein
VDKSSPKAPGDLPAYARLSIHRPSVGRRCALCVRESIYMFAPKRELDQARQKQSTIWRFFSRSYRHSRRATDKFYDQTAVSTASRNQPLQTQSSENLAALGYVSSGAVGQSQDCGSRPQFEI